MKHTLLVFVIIYWSCKKVDQDYDVVIAKQEYINSDFLQRINPPEKALLTWYLYAYGNECEEKNTVGNQSVRLKCQLLKALDIMDECDSGHLNNLLQWFSTDMLAVYKLNQCPNLPNGSAIQNNIDHIALKRFADTLSITIKVRGQNESQEKTWDLEQTESYLIRESHLSKINESENP